MNLEQLRANIWDTIRLNVKIIFANKFIYFFGAAFLIFIMVTAISLSNADAYPTEESVYYLLLVPGMLLIFYPTAFSIQTDSDAGTLETLFGVPDYRYKIWLVRLAIIAILVYILLLFFSSLSFLALAPVDIFGIALQLMFPLLFIGTLSFLIATMIRNGNGTAAVMVLIGLVFWISSGILEESEWNIFLNPYSFPNNVNQIVWQDIIFYNRIYLLAGSILFTLGALLRLQNREKFMQ